MYLYFASFYDFSIIFWNCSNSVVFLYLVLIFILLQSKKYMYFDKLNLDIYIHLYFHFNEYIQDIYVFVIV